MPACANSAFVHTAYWHPEGGQPVATAPVGAVRVVISYQPPFDGLGSTRTVAIVSDQGVVIRQEADDPDQPKHCVGQPPAVAAPSNAPTRASAPPG